MLASGSQIQMNGLNLPGQPPREEFGTSLAVWPQRRVLAVAVLVDRTSCHEQGRPLDRRCEAIPATAVSFFGGITGLSVRFACLLHSSTIVLARSTCLRRSSIGEQPAGEVSRPALRIGSASMPAAGVQDAARARRRAAGLAGPLKASPAGCGRGTRRWTDLEEEEEKRLCGVCCFVFRRAQPADLRMLVCGFDFTTRGWGRAKPRRACTQARSPMAQTADRRCTQRLRPLPQLRYSAALCWGRGGSKTGESESSTRLCPVWPVSGSVCGCEAARRRRCPNRPGRGAR
jgi:hypothetical protein